MPCQDIAPASRRIAACCCKSAAGTGAGYRHLSGGDFLPLLETGIQAIQLSPYHADLPARRPVRLGTAAGFLACYCPLHLSALGLAIRSRDISSHLCPLRGLYNTAPR